MAKRWNGRKMSHGKLNLTRPLKKANQTKPAPTQKKRKAQ